MNRIITKIDSQTKLVPLSRRLGFIYLEHAMVVVRNFSLVYFSKDSEAFNSGIGYPLPTSVIGGLILGPGCSLTTEGARVAAENGMDVYFSMGGGLPLRSAMIRRRSPSNRIKQYKNCLDPQKRLAAAKLLLERRSFVIEKHGCGSIPPLFIEKSYESIEQLLGHEAAWGKKAYHSIAKDLKVKWPGKKELAPENPLILLNHLSYQAADLVISHLGYDPDLGVIHGQTKGGGLVYDLADVWKPIIALYPGLLHMSTNENRPNIIRAEFLNKIMKFDVLGEMTKVLKEIFE